MLAHLATFAFLGGIILTPIVAAVLCQRKTQFSFPQFLLWVLAQFLTRILWRASVSGPLPLAPGQGAILVCNHRSSVDPFFIQTLAVRKTHWLVAREYCEHPAFRSFLRLCEVIPASRGGIDTAAIRAAIRLTSQGGIVGMLPEGRINMTDRLLLPGRPGAALVALKARMPILPCYIEGSPYDRVPWSPFFMPARVKVHFGVPLDVSEFYGREREEGVLEEVLRRAMKAIAALAGDPHFEPELAGRQWKPTRAELDADIAASRRRRGNRRDKSRLKPMN